MHYSRCWLGKNAKFPPCHPDYPSWPFQQVLPVLSFPPEKQRFCCPLEFLRQWRVHQFLPFHSVVLFQSTVQVVLYWLESCGIFLQGYMCMIGVLCVRITIFYISN